MMLAVKRKHGRSSKDNTGRKDEVQISTRTKKMRISLTN